jgi:hypothetical protein
MSAGPWPVELLTGRQPQVAPAASRGLRNRAIAHEVGMRYQRHTSTSDYG